MVQKIESEISQEKKREIQRKQMEEWKQNLENHKQIISQITNDNFTIFSSNCWGGTIYEDLKIPYQTPTIGLFFYAPCFIELLKNLRNNVESKLEFTDTSKYYEANEYRETKESYPIGLLNNTIEIHFLHYKTEEDALKKWEIRKERINWNNLYISCTDRDLMTPELIKEFDNLNHSRKILLTSKEYNHLTNSIQIQAFKDESFVGDLYRFRYLVTKDFNVAQWLNQK